MLIPPFVQYVRMHQARTGHGRRFEAPGGPIPELCMPSEFSDDNEERWVVTRIGGKRTMAGILYYQVFWEGFAEPSWEPADMIKEDAPLAVKQFMDGIPSGSNKHGDLACVSRRRYVQQLYNRHHLC